MIEFDTESIGLIITFSAFEKACFAVSGGPLAPIFDCPLIDM
jgi:hypothetical protein